MEVAGEQIRFYPEQVLKVLHTIFERAQGLVVFQVTDVVAEKSIFLAGDTKSVLKLSAESQDGRGCQGIWTG